MRRTVTLIFAVLLFAAACEDNHPTKGCTETDNPENSELLHTGPYPWANQFDENRDDWICVSPATYASVKPTLPPRPSYPTVGA